MPPPAHDPRSDAPTSDERDDRQDRRQGVGHNMDVSRSKIGVAARRGTRTIVMIAPMVLWPMMVVFVLAVGMFTMAMRMALAPMSTPMQKPRARQIDAETDHSDRDRG